MPLVFRLWFLKKRLDILGEIADSKSVAANSQYKPGTSCHSRKWRRYPHSLGSCQETRAKLKGLQVAKDETACASKYIITVIGYATHKKFFHSMRS